MIPRRAWIIPIAAVLILLAIGVRARADEPAKNPDRLPPGIDCPTIRALVAHHGKVAALRWAVTQGYGWRQIAAARACLK